MEQSKQYYSARIAEFIERPYLVQRWFTERGAYRSVKEIVDFYQVIKNMWFTHRELFSCKGQYKQVRRMFVKYAASSFACRTILCVELPGDMCKEILDKVNQGWISSLIEVDEKMWKILVKKAVGYTGNKLHPWERNPL